MSQAPFGDASPNPYQSPEQTASAHSTGDEAPTPRLVSATVFGTLNILFAVLGGCGIAFTFVLLLAPPNPQMPNPAIEAMRENAFYSVFSKFSMSLGFIAAIVLVAAGVGLLQMKSWGRTLSIVYAVYAILSTTVGLIVNYFVLLGPLLEKANELPAGPERAAAIGGAIGGVVGGCFGAIYPVVLLGFMLRPNFAAALKR